MKQFLDLFESRTKLEQDTIMFLAWNDASESKIGKNQACRREFYFLDKYVRRVCLQALLGVSSHRLDKLGAIDMRFGARANSKASVRTASVDSFCLVLYNSIAEPLPNRQGFCLPNRKHCLFKTTSTLTLQGWFELGLRGDTRL